MNILQIAKELGACPDAIGWLNENKHLTAEQLYNQCPRGDWLTWFFVEIGVDRELVVFAACDCVDLVKHLLPDNAPKDTTDIVRAYYKSEAALEDVRDAVCAIVVANGNAAYATWSVALATAYTNSDDYISAAVNTAISAATDAIAGASRMGMRKQYADVVRNVIPFEILSDALQAYQESAK